jgi:hypothetical protein
MGTETRWPNACTDRPRGVFFRKREVRARAVVVTGIGGQDAAKVRLADDDDMVEAVPPDRADQSFGMAVLPRRARRGRSVANAHGLDAPRDDGAVGCIAITDEVSRCFIPRECLGDLPGNPLGGRMCGDVGPYQPSPSEV